MSTRHTVEGITIDYVNYRDYDRIITVFSHEVGVLKLFFRGSNRHSFASALTSPLTRGEFVYSTGKGNNDLFFFCDGTVVDQHLSIRQDLDTLDAACEMLKIIKATQFPGKAAPLLYRTLSIFLHTLPAGDNTNAMLASFILKTLKHEGLLSIEGSCAVCGATATSIYHGELFCAHHSRQSGVPVSLVELELLRLLTASRTMHDIVSTEIDLEMLNKVRILHDHFFVLTPVPHC